MRKLSAIQKFLHNRRSEALKLRTCGQHLLCPFCAAIRASRAIQKYVERIDQVLKKIASSSLFLSR
jgi:predicted Na+-dependent transporter